MNNNTENIIKEIMYDFEEEILPGLLNANEKWRKLEEKRTTLEKELNSKLEKIDPKLKNELRKLEDLYTILECIELEICFVKGFKEGVKFLKDCL